MSLGFIRVKNINARKLEFHAFEQAEALKAGNIDGELTVRCDKTGSKKVYQVTAVKNSTFVRQGGILGWLSYWFTAGLYVSRSAQQLNKQLANYRMAPVQKQPAPIPSAVNSQPSRTMTDMTQSLPTKFNPAYQKDGSPKARVKTERATTSLRARDFRTVMMRQYQGVKLENERQLETLRELMFESNDMYEKRLAMLKQCSPNVYQLWIKSLQLPRLMETMDALKLNNEEEYQLELNALSERDPDLHEMYLKELKKRKPLQQVA
ncbi:hypothetical protein [Parashewanella tropica]|uniref:hypothetical protein n=1 Tax=Parashewanella tropica TaxID=2547970 RepID=UPI00105A3900|nr:hypothetical protein [Parashewanella tropica]